jgi:hypothetical protein
MNYREMEQLLEEDCLGYVEDNESAWGNGIDKPLRREVFNNWIDLLHSEGLITEKQLNTWGCPQWFEEGTR